MSKYYYFKLFKGATAPRAPSPEPPCMKPLESDVWYIYQFGGLLYCRTRPVLTPILITSAPELARQAVARQWLPVQLLLGARGSRCCQAHGERPRDTRSARGGTFAAAKGKFV